MILLLPVNTSYSVSSQLSRKNTLKPKVQGQGEEVAISDIKQGNE